MNYQLKKRGIDRAPDDNSPTYLLFVLFDSLNDRRLRIALTSRFFNESTSDRATCTFTHNRAPFRGRLNLGVLGLHSSGTRPLGAPPSGPSSIVARVFPHLS